MGMTSILQVGPIATTTSMADGNQAPQRAGKLGDTIMSQFAGRDYETCYRRQLFSAANQSATTTSAGLATTHTGLVLSNPVGSTVNLVLDKVGFHFGVAFPAAASIGLMCGYNSSTNVTHTTPVTPRSNYFGIGSAGVGLVDAASTLPTAPIVTHIFTSGLTGAITTAIIGTVQVYDLEGSIILPPGAYAAIYTSTASGTSSFQGAMQWMEFPV